MKECDKTLVGPFRAWQTKLVSTFGLPIAFIFQLMLHKATKSQTPCPLLLAFVSCPVLPCPALRSPFFQLSIMPSLPFHRQSTAATTEEEPPSIYLEDDHQQDYDAEEEEVCPHLISVEQPGEDALHMSGLSLDEEQPATAIFTAPHTAHNETLPKLGRLSTRSLGLSSLASTGSTARTVQLVAPSNLPPGYQFVARLSNGQEVVVEVFHSDGVRQGQTFDAMVLHEASTKSKLRAQPGHFTPHGYWRDGLLLGCFRFGILHPVFCLACWCSPLLLAQVMTRLGLNVWGRPNNTPLDAQPQKTLDNVRSLTATSRWSIHRTISTLLCLHFVLIETALSIVVVAQIHNRQIGDIKAVPTWTYVLLAIRLACRIALFSYLVLIAVRTRTAVRERFGIPEQFLECGIEDALVALACQPCSAAQLARHTADYETYDAVCCTSTGLSAYAPST